MRQALGYNEVTSRGETWSICDFSFQTPGLWLASESLGMSYLLPELRPCEDVTYPSQGRETSALRGGLLHFSCRLTGRKGL